MSTHTMTKDFFSAIINYFVPNQKLFWGHPIANCNYLVDDQISHSFIISVCDDFNTTW